MGIGFASLLLWQTAALYQLTPDYAPADPDLKAVRIDSHPTESFLAVRADPMGRLFVGGRESLFVYEPDDKGGYRARQQLMRFPKHSWVYDIEVRGNDLYVLTLSALYLIPDGVIKRDHLQIKKLIWGVPLGHVHQCFHALAWGPEGDLYISMGDPLWYYGNFERPDHWGYWHFLVQPKGTKVPYHGVGGVFRCRPDGSHFQVVSRGLRNPCGLVFDRHWNLFSNDNDHESLPAMYVPGRLLHVTPHSWFSWPRGWMTLKTPERADLLQTMFDGMGRAVPVGQSYYHETFLPEKYRDNLLVARWCIRAVTRYPLATRGASFKTTESLLLVGKNDARPVGVCVGRGGRIFVTIAYMAHNEESPVYRSDLVMITRSDDLPAHPFEPYDPTVAKPEKLWQELADPSWNRRYRAHLEILRRGDLVKQAEQRLAECRRDNPALDSLIWLAAKGADGNPSKAVVKLAADRDPVIRAQALRAIAEFHASFPDSSFFTRALDDLDPRVQLAGVLAFFHPKRDFVAAAYEAILRGPARSADSYLRQPAALLLAERSTLDRLVALSRSAEASLRMAGILAIGFRLTVPRATQPLPDDMPLAKWYNGAKAYMITYADGKADLRNWGRLGTYTVAEHWKARKKTDEHERLFALLRERLGDSVEVNRLQAASFLSLLDDPRSEPDVIKTRAASAARKLAAAPLKIIDQLWVIGPCPNGKDGIKTNHPPAKWPIDLTQTYTIGQAKLTWKEEKTDKLFDWKKRYGTCANASFYACTRMECSGRERILLLLDCYEGIIVWHNGKEVWSRDDVRAATPHRNEIVLDLEPGSNDLLFRIRNGSGACVLFSRYRCAGQVVLRLPEKIDFSSLGDRLKNARADKGGATIGKEFLTVDWRKAAREGNVRKGRELFTALSCVKCHAITNTVNIVGGPSLAEANKRFTVPYLVESILLPSKQVSPAFKASIIETKQGQSLTGLVVKETADELELLMLDTKRKTIRTKDIESRKVSELSPMPAGLVRTPEELRDLLAYLLSKNP